MEVDDLLDVRRHAAFAKWTLCDRSRHAARASITDIRSNSYPPPAGFQPMHRLKPTACSLRGAAALPLTPFQHLRPLRYCPCWQSGLYRASAPEMKCSHQPKQLTSFPFDNSYARLPDRFFARLPPTPVAAPRLIRLNEKLARHLGLDPVKLASPEGVAILAGNPVPKLGEPLAMAYAGHQFGTFVPQLGDGRAILLGEVVDRRWRAPRHPAQGLGPDAVLAQRRRPRRARAGPARIHRQRGDGRARDADDPIARRRRNRRDGPA